MESRCLLSVSTAPVNVPASVIPLERTDSHSVERQNQINATIQSGNDRVVFIGDSNVEFSAKIGGGAWANTIGPRFGSANFGVASDSTANLLWRLDNGELAGKPDVAVVEIGMNNVLFHEGTPAPDAYSSETVSQTVAGITAVLDTIAKVSPDTKILLMGVFPVGATASDPQRLEVQAINAQLAKVANGHNAEFLNIDGLLLNPDGSRPVTPEGIHLTPALYGVWADAITAPLTHLISLSEHPSGDFSGDGTLEITTTTAPGDLSLALCDGAGFTNQHAKHAIAQESGAASSSTI